MCNTISKGGKRCTMPASGHLKSSEKRLKLRVAYIAGLETKETTLRGEGKVEAADHKRTEINKKTLELPELEKQVKEWASKSKIELAQRAAIAEKRAKERQRKLDEKEDAAMLKQQEKQIADAARRAAAANVRLGTDAKAIAKWEATEKELALKGKRPMGRRPKVTAYPVTVTHCVSPAEKAEIDARMEAGGFTEYSAYLRNEIRNPAAFSSTRASDYRIPQTAHINGGVLGRRPAVTESQRTILLQAKLSDADVAIADATAIRSRKTLSGTLTGWAQGKDLQINEGDISKRRADARIRNYMSLEVEAGINEKSKPEQILAYHKQQHAKLVAEVDAEYAARKEAAARSRLTLVEAAEVKKAA